jgi:succinate dehydrogenase / fumarate reductase flavoprotein subunit
LGQGNRPPLDHPEFRRVETEVTERMKRLISCKGKRTPTEIHREIGRMMWDYCGMSRSEAGLKHVLQKLPEYRESFWRDVHVPGSGEELNISLERAGRVYDFIEFAELMALDALTRNESCGGHFREEYQFTDEEAKADPTGKTIKGEAKRDDANFCHVAAWEYRGPDQPPQRHQEPLVFTEAKPTLRSYK